MRSFASKAVNQFSLVPIRMALAAALGVVGFSVVALNASPALAGIVSHGRLVAPDVTLAARTEAPGTWSNAEEVPGTASLNAGLNAGVYSISCSSSGNCSAGGNYVDGSGNYQAFVVNESGGTWGTAIEVPGTAALNTGGSAVVASVSCSSDGSCGAAGSYADSAGNVSSFVVNESGGNWGNAVVVVDPSAVLSTKAVGAESISCTGNGSCTAVGQDITAIGDSVGFAVSETGGEWSDAVEITLVSTFGPGGTSLDNVSCDSPGNCSAAGNGAYPDSAISGGFATIPFEDNETNGAWGAPMVFPGLATLNVGLLAISSSISCSSPGNCSSGGAYTDGSGKSQAFVVSETNGAWGNAVEVPGTSALNLGGAILTGLSCASNSNCGGTGLYTDVAGNAQAFVVDESGGAWGNAIEVPGSSSLFTQGTATNGDSISCASAGNCASGGAYFDASGNAQAFVVTEKDGNWGDAIEVPGSATLNTGGGAYIASVSCSADTSCAAGGWYSTGAQQFQAFTSDMTPLFATQAPLQLTTTHGTVGTALTLKISGGSGTGAVTYSVASGSSKGCAISGDVLKAASPGTCKVTASKSGDSTYLATSTTSSVSMALPAKPKTLTVEFTGTSSALTAAAKSELRALAKKLITGASVTVTGYAKGNATLAKSRADSVKSYLGQSVHLSVTVKTNTASSMNAATVATTKQ